MQEETRTGWYLVFTKPNHENLAKINLQQQGFNIYLPLLQQHKRRRNIYQVVTEPLFPRYLFINLHSEGDDWSKVRSTRGCISLVRFGMLPARVPDDLVTKLKQDEQTRSVSEIDTTPEFKPGDKVQIIDGLLANYEGIVEMKNSQQRITLLLDIAEGHTRRVNFSVHQVRMVN